MVELNVIISSLPPRPPHTHSFIKFSRLQTIQLQQKSLSLKHCSIYFLSPLNIASAQDRALQALSSELAQLDRQITALLKKQDEILLQKCSSYTRRCCFHACPTLSLGTTVPQRAFQTFTATPADLHLLQPIRRPQLNAYAFTYFFGPHRLPQLLGARVLDIAKRLPSPPADATSSGPWLSTSGPTTSLTEVMRRGSERFSRLFALQSWLRGCCAFNGLGYVDNWSSFWEQKCYS
ncbi:hypothetical protein AOLI_G00135900 [Acnodon oligacanthus]